MCKQSDNSFVSNGLTVEFELPPGTRVGRDVLLQRYVARFVRDFEYYSRNALGSRGSRVAYLKSKFRHE